MRSALARLLAIALLCWAPSTLAQGAIPVGPTYILDASLDGPVILMAGVAAASPLFQKEAPPAWCAPVCDSSRLNAFDRQVAGVYRPTWARVSDVSLGLLMATPFVVLVLDEGLSATLSDAVVLAEMQLVAGGFAAMTSAAVRRPRPFLYGESAPLAARMEGDGALSFFSGHTTNAFAAAVGLYRTLARRHPHSSLPLLTLGAGLATASLVGAGRVLAGKHFPTDVVGGALVGSSVGILVPALHRSGVGLSPFADPSALGLQISGVW